MEHYKEIRLILGDQLNINHPWFDVLDDTVLYVLMEVRTETDYVNHHIQKVLALFLTMRCFSKTIAERGHKVKYISLDNPNNKQAITANLKQLQLDHSVQLIQYQLPDEFRVDQELKNLENHLNCSVKSVDTFHFLTSREELGDFFEGKKLFLMENFYRYMRKKHNILMDALGPIGGKWNFDEENRKKLPKNHKPIAPLVFSHNVVELKKMLIQHNVTTIGNASDTLIWPISREESLELLNFFIQECLVLFGTFQDAMTPSEWSLYHSRISFALNIKLIHPKEVIDATISHWEKNKENIAFNQVEGFVRQILGWREYMRGMYWLHMPDFAKANFFGAERALPNWFWNGQTKMSCLKHSIQQSLNYAYAHHIQRLMLTGNFALIAGINPDEVDKWYLGIYIDAFEWVEITNTRGMSQYADGGLIASKPYAGSASYMDKMSHYCSGCKYDKKIRHGANACPFNSLYWDFIARNEWALKDNQRMAMIYGNWNRFSSEEKTAIRNQAQTYLNTINEL